MVKHSEFVFSSSDPSIKKKKAILGNGYFGCDVSNNFGQGFGVCEPKDPFPVTYLGGAYSHSFHENEREHGDLDSIFRPLNTYGLIPEEQSRFAEISDSLFGESFKQILDTKNAVISTEGKWNNYDVETEIFLCRNFVHFGIMKMRVIPLSEHVGNFLHIVRKDPRSRYETLERTEQDGISYFNGTIEEDGYNFQGKGLFQIVQTTFVRVTDDDGKEIPANFSWESNDEGLGLDEERGYACKIELPDGKTRGNSSITKKQAFNIYLYFGIFKDSDLKSSSSDLVELARVETLDVIQRPYELLKKTHTEAWQNEIWTGLVEIPLPEVQKRAISSMYQLGCSFKSGHPNSAGPVGLNGFAWEGHVFWDADLWVNLGMLIWAPELSRCITEFRKDTMDGAKQHRKNYVDLFEIENVDSGIKFPWQSTTSGLEMSPFGWEAQEHITCDVIFGQYLYYTASKDERYLKEIALPLSFEACKYLGQRVKKEGDGKYHFRGVVPADEYPFPNLVDDNAFTNLYVARCMGIVTKWCKKANKAYPPHWEEIRDNMFYNFDETEKRIVEFTGYKGQTIKQADTNLITFPMEWPLSEEVKKNNMLYYFDKLPENKIMMGSAIFSIIACELDLKEKSWEYFEDLFPHFHKDLFYIASESPTNECWPFITGLGGFLACLYYGFGGIRLRMDGLLISPNLPKNIPELTFNAIRYQNREFELKIWNGGNNFSLKNKGNSTTFLLYFRKAKPFKALDKTIPCEEIKERAELRYLVNFKKGEVLEFKKND